MEELPFSKESDSHDGEHECEYSQNAHQTQHLVEKLEERVYDLLHCLPVAAGRNKINDKSETLANIGQ